MTEKPEEQSSEVKTEPNNFELKFTGAIAHNAAAILMCTFCAAALYCNDFYKEAEVFVVLGSIFVVNLVRLEFMYNQNEQ